MNQTTPITPQLLLDIASEADETYQTLSKEFPAGTVHDGRNKARRVREDALFCAEWLEQQGVDGMENVGPFMNTSIQRGQKVRIKRGSRIYSTHPSITREGIVSQKAQVVKVHQVYKGLIDRYEPPYRVKQGEVHWAGTGGYWRWTDINNVELVENKEG